MEDSERIQNLEFRLDIARSALREALLMTGRECDADINRLLNFPRKLIPVLRRGLTQSGCPSSNALGDLVDSN